MLKKNIKLVLIRNWRHKSLQRQIVPATAELFMQLFMQRIALPGWAICWCFCSKDPAPRCQCWNQGFWVPAWTAWVVMIAECLVPPSGEWMGCHNTSVSLAAPWGMGNGIKTKLKQMQNLWPICKCCFWGYLFLCILRARWGMPVYCCLGYLIPLLSMKCNSFFFLKGFANDLRWTEELPFGFHVSPAK